MNLSALSVGQYYFFYLNHWNEVAFVAESGSYSAYWLMEIKKGSGLDPTVSVRGLSESGEIVNYDLNKYKNLMKNPIVLDGRNCYNLNEVAKLDIKYYSIGR